MLQSIKLNRLSKHDLYTKTPVIFKNILQEYLVDKNKDRWSISRLLKFILKPLLDYDAIFWHSQTTQKGLFTEYLEYQLLYDFDSLYHIIQSSNLDICYSGYLQW